MTAAKLGLETPGQEGGTVQVRPILYFEGFCEEAVEFYRQALGAQVLMLMRFKDAPGYDQHAEVAPGAGNKVIHATLLIGDITLQVNDGNCSARPSFEGFSLSITVDQVDEADRLFTALADGGKVTMPMTETFFSPRYGIVVDRFGVSWKIHVVT
jgi:PhnB protein